LVVHIEGIFKDILENINCVVYDFLRCSKATLNANNWSVSVGYLAPYIFKLNGLANYLKCDILCKSYRLLHLISLEKGVHKIDPVLDENLYILSLVPASHRKDIGGRSLLIK
jgi:hypothetical protein